MMTVVIEAGTGVFWTYKLVAQAQDTPLSLAKSEDALIAI